MNKKTIAAALVASAMLVPTCAPAYTSGGYVSDFTVRDIDTVDLGGGSYIDPIVLDANGGQGGPLLIRWVNDYNHYLDYGYWEQYELPPCPFSRPGYKFSGWKVYDGCYVGDEEYMFVDSNGARRRIGGFVGTRRAYEEVDICGWTALVAQWREEVAYSPEDGYARSFCVDDLYYECDYNDFYYSCPVLLVANGGKGGPLLAKGRSDRLYEIPTCPFTRDGYEFIGWKMFDPCMDSIGECHTITSCVLPSGETYSWGKRGYNGVWPPGERYELCGIHVLVAQWYNGSPMRLAVNPNKANYGTATGGGTYAAGTSVALKATAKSGYVFAGWFKDKSCKTALSPKGYDNRSPTVKFVMPENDATVYAKFITAAAAKKSLKFSSATKKFAKTPKKVKMGSSFSLKLGISSASLPKVTAKGLPKGLSIDRTTGKITGVPTTPGSYTATVTVKDAAGNKITQKVKITVTVPDWAKGTFHGYTHNGSFGKYSRNVTITVASSGKVTAKVGAYSFSGAKLKMDDNWRNAEPGQGIYVFSTKKNGNSLSFTIYPWAGWSQDALVGDFHAGNNRDTRVCARKNATAANATAKKIAAKLAKRGTEFLDVANNKSPYGLECPACWEGTAYSRVYVRADKNGKVTLSGAIGRTQVSGTAYLSYEYVDKYGDEDLYPHARFFSGKFVLEIFYMSNALTGGMAWTK